MAEIKNERLHLRTTKRKKQFLMRLAEEEFKGNLNALFDRLIEELEEEYPYLVEDYIEEGDE